MGRVFVLKILEFKVNYFLWWTLFVERPTSHSSLVDYLAQVKYAKNCPTTFYCIFSIGMGSYDHHAKYQGVFL